MNLKKRLFVSLWWLSPLVVAHPAMAMPQDQWNCALTEPVVTSAMMDTAYRLLMPPEQYDAKTKEEKPDYDRKIVSAVEACSKIYNWNGDETEHVMYYTTSGLALLGATSRLIDAGVDEKPLRAALANLSDADWAAWTSSDDSVGQDFINRFYPIIRNILLKQGFETMPTEKGYNKKVHVIVRQYLKYSVVFKEEKIWLSLPPVKAAPVIIERSDADQYNDSGMRSYNLAQKYFKRYSGGFYSDQSMDVCKSLQFAWRYYEFARVDFQSAIRNYGYGDTKSDPNEDVGQNYNTTVSMMNFAHEEFENRGCLGRIDAEL